MDQYKCSYADVYIKKMKRLMVFAYSGDGLDIGNTGSQNFAHNNVDSICDDYKLEKIFKEKFTYAYHSLDYGTEDARDYAKKEVFPAAFSCN